MKIENGEIYEVDGINTFSLLGRNEENIPFLEEIFGLKVFSRGNKLFLKGQKEAIQNAIPKIKKLANLTESGEMLSKEEIMFQLQTNSKEKNNIILPKKVIKPRTIRQKDYLGEIKKNTIIFAIGPAGTGKTYLAVASALNALLRKEVSRIVLTRPAVEAGENLGYLPGSFIEKVDPYLRPLYDALYDMLPVDKVRRYIDNGIIEIAPLAFMRGRTLSESFILLDEAQNTTHTQLKMFLTRIGENSKAIITGDITQIDLPGETVSGLVEIQKVLKDLQGVKFIYLTSEDVVRNNLVQKIVQAYEDYENE